MTAGDTISFPKISGDPTTGRRVLRPPKRPDRLHHLSSTDLGSLQSQSLPPSPLSSTLLRSCCTGVAPILAGSHGPFLGDRIRLPPTDWLLWFDRDRDRTICPNHDRDRVKTRISLWSTKRRYTHYAAKSRPTPVHMGLLNERVN